VHEDIAARSVEARQLSGRVQSFLKLRRNRIFIRAGECFYAQRLQEITWMKQRLRPLRNWNSSKSGKNVWKLERSNSCHWIQPGEIWTVEKISRLGGSATEERT
jgi:hypothetical protein